MRVSGLDHIVLNVRDVEASLEFYQRHLGLVSERVEAWRRGEVRFPSLRLNASTIIDLVGAPVANGGTHPNLAHFCVVTDETDLNRSVAELRIAGIDVEQGPVIRSGARGDALSIYIRDPDNNQIEVRTYTRLAALQASLDAAHAQLVGCMDRVADLDGQVYDSWSKQDVVAHLTSIEARIRQQVQCAMQGATWQAEDIDAFNAKQVNARRGWTMNQLRFELEDQRAASRALLQSLGEADLQRPFDHPRRGRITIEDLWSTIPRHVEQHLADLELAHG